MGRSPTSWDELGVSGERSPHPPPPHFKTLTWFLPSGEEVTAASLAPFSSRWTQKPNTPGWFPKERVPPSLTPGIRHGSPPVFYVPLEAGFLGIS